MAGTAATVVSAVATAGVAAAGVAVLAMLGTLLVMLAAEWGAKKVLALFVGDKEAGLGDPSFKDFDFYSDAEFGARNRAAGRRDSLTDGPPERGVDGFADIHLFDDDEYERNRP